VIRYALLAVFALSFQMAFATTVEVDTDKPTYNYGDYLTITVGVSDVTDDIALMHIIGPDEVKSSPIQIQIKERTTSITTPNAFDPAIFKEGTYRIEIEYGGAVASTRFDLVDAGNLYLPIGSNIVISQWRGGVISDHSLLRFLADNTSLAINLSDAMEIPSWYKTNAVWWLEKRISDGEFLNGLQYLIDEKIIA